MRAIQRISCRDKLTEVTAFLWNEVLKYITISRNILCGPELRYIMIRTTIISVIASFVVFGAWIINEVSYHPAAGPNPLAPLSSNVD